MIRSACSERPSRAKGSGPHRPDDLAALGITVAVIDGTATLTGIVKTDAQKAGAARLAMGVRGVRRVDNKLIVEGQG